MQAEKKERVDKSMNKGNMKCNLDKYNGICAADRVTNKRQVDMIPGPLVLFASSLPDFIKKTTIYLFNRSIRKF